MKLSARRFFARYFGWAVEVPIFLKLKYENFKKPPIVVLTFGKVGSSSIYETLKFQNSYPVFHLHNLTEETIVEGIRKHMESDRSSIPLHLRISRRLHKKIQNYTKEIFIITIVREPISREISSFFQNTEFHKNSLEGKNMEVNEIKAKEMLIGNLSKKTTDDLEEWFEAELKKPYGIDVFSKEFKKAKGYEIIKNGRYNLLILKMETMNKIFTEAIFEFLPSLKGIELKNANMGDQKHYAETYKSIKRNLKIGGDNLEDILRSKYFQHFYPESVNEVREKWIKVKQC